MAPIRNLRWYIAGLLFLSTTINYIDRQTLGALAPHIKQEFHWTNETFALLIIAFRVAYTIGQSLSGRLLDKFGTRRGLSIAVALYSTAALLTSTATGLASFCGFRFLLGLGESANWPGAAKTVAEWFPRKESGWAVAIFDSGSAIGGAVAPMLVYWVYHSFGGWRPAFLVTGILGFLWIPLFLKFYRAPEEHPRLSPDERTLILSERAEADLETTTSPLSYKQLLTRPDTWGIILAKSFTDPVWFFITDWFALFLVSRGFKPEESLLAFWAPFLAADIGNFAGGGASSLLIKRGWPLIRARKVVALTCALGMGSLAAVAYLDGFTTLVISFSLATFCYAAFSTIVLALPADLYPTKSVASVSGLSGTGAGIGTIIATYLTGFAADHYSFKPVLIVASLMPVVAGILLMLLVRGKDHHSSFKPS